jgi:hypothetical protein
VKTSRNRLEPEHLLEGLEICAVRSVRRSWSNSQFPAQVAAGA